MGVRALTCLFFCFNDTATTEIYTLSLHDALPILQPRLGVRVRREQVCGPGQGRRDRLVAGQQQREDLLVRSEEHTSELQSRQYLVCRLLLEKKKNVFYPSLDL